MVIEHSKRKTGATYSYSRGWYAILDRDGQYVCHLPTEAAAIAKIAELDKEDAK